MIDFAPLAVLALLLDHLLGEPRRWHPLVEFGWLAHKVEHLLYGAATVSPLARIARGLLGLLLLLALGSLPAWLACWPGVAGSVASVALLYVTLGLRSLGSHAEAVALALEQDNLPAARLAVGRIVSRDCTDLDSAGVATAATESVLENGCDAVFGALFWFLVLGAPGAVLYRCANTLDAMWGYRTPRYLYFGRSAARLDDLLNYLPARLTALTYAVLGATGSALGAWYHQGRQWYSPNAGPVMAAGAGALRVRLGGAAVYHGQEKIRPELGAGARPTSRDLRRAIRLTQRGAWLWVVLALGFWSAGRWLG